MSSLVFSTSLSILTPHKLFSSAKVTHTCAMNASATKNSSNRDDTNNNNNNDEEESSQSSTFCVHDASKPSCPRTLSSFSSTLSSPTSSPCPSPIPSCYAKRRTMGSSKQHKRVRFADEDTHTIRYCNRSWTLDDAREQWYTPVDFAQFRQGLTFVAKAIGRAEQTHQHMRGDHRDDEDDDDDDSLLSSSSFWPLGEWTYTEVLQSVFQSCCDESHPRMDQDPPVNSSNSSVSSVRRTAAMWSASSILRASLREHLWYTVSEHGCGAYRMGLETHIVRCLAHDRNRRRRELNQRLEEIQYGVTPGESHPSKSETAKKSRSGNNIFYCDPHGDDDEVASNAGSPSFDPAVRRLEEELRLACEHISRPHRLWAHVIAQALATAVAESP